MVAVAKVQPKKWRKSVAAEEYEVEHAVEAPAGAEIRLFRAEQAIAEFT